MKRTALVEASLTAKQGVVLASVEPMPGDAGPPRYDRKPEGMTPPIEYDLITGHTRPQDH